MVGFPDTPSPFDTEILFDVPVSVRCAQVSVVVRTASPVDASPSSAARSLDKENVGFPDTPLPLDTDMPAAGPVIVRPVKVSADVCVRMPFVLYPAKAVRVESRVWYAVELQETSPAELVCRFAQDVAPCRYALPSTESVPEDVRAVDAAIVDPECDALREKTEPASVSPWPAL